MMGEVVTEMESTWICNHCGEANIIGEVETFAHLETHRSEIETEIRAEVAEEIASMQRKVRAREIEAESLKKMSDDQIQSKIDLALAHERSALNAQFLLDQQGLRNENDKLKRDIAALGKRSSQGSVQAQGEAGEILIEDLLRKTFPNDQVKEIKKGARGADCLLIVSAGQVSSGVLIESKVTQRWEGTKWLPKLRADMEAENASIGILVTDKFPPGQTTAFLDGNIWVVRFHEVLGVAGAVRQGLDQLNRLKLSRGTAESTAQEMLDFLTSPRFASIVESMLSPVSDLRDQLVSEKRAFEKQWRIRENAINKMFDSAALFHGELISIAGENIPEINSLPSVNNLLSEEK